MGKKIKIGFLTERMLLGFGVDLVIDRTAEGLAERGYQVTVFASLTDGTYDEKKYKVKSIPTPAVRFFPIYDMNARRWLDSLNQEEIDIFLIETFPFFSLIPGLNKPCIAVDHGVCSTEGFPFQTKINFFYMKTSQQHYYFKAAKKVATVSEFIKRSLPNSIQKKTTVIYNGADHYLATDNLNEKAVSFRREIGVEVDDILLLYVGRLNPDGQPYKGVKELFEVFDRCNKSNPKIKMLMVGYGDEKDRRLIERRGIIPYIKAPAEMMPVIFNACDIYVTASRWEGFDLPAVEAQFFGKPVVVLNIGAHPEVIKNNNTGFLLPSIEEFPDILLELADDREQRLKMGEKAQKFVEKFHWERTVEEYEQLIQEVV